jgi:uncharacterized membrane protein YccF (DUF307 family)
MSIFCTTEPCPTILGSHCVFYRGNDLIYINVVQNDSLQVALEKINTAISTIVVGGTTWGSITGTLSNQADLIAYLTSNFYPLTNPAGFITSSALAPYLTSAIAATTYVPLTREITINGITQDLSVNRTWTISAGVWGAITGTITDQTDLTTYLSSNYYPLFSNPAGYLTSFTELDPVFTTWLAGPPDLSEFNNDVGYVDAAGAAAAAPIQSVTGTAVDNTDPANPVIDLPVGDNAGFRRTFLLMGA